MTFDWVEFYDSNERKIVVITHSLNHGFIDRDKRIGIGVMILLCEMNNIILRYIQQELIELRLSTASGTMNEEDIYKWLIEHKQKVVAK